MRYSDFTKRKKYLLLFFLPFLIACGGGSASEPKENNLAVTGENNLTGAGDELEFKALNVPADYSTIKDALSHAVDGDTILLAPGTYSENELDINKNNITISSKYLTTGDESYIDNTIIQGDSHTYFITGLEGQSKNLKLVGLTIKEARKAINFNDDNGEVDHCKIYNDASDSISFEKYAGGGSVTYCLLDNSKDDGIDIDAQSHGGEFLIAYNRITDSHDDGMEIRLFPSDNQKYYDIHDNLWSGSGEDGIQLIDYADNTASNRIFDIYRNIFENNSDAGLGTTENANSIENFNGASIKERITLYNNYFYANGYHVTGGDNMIIVNNIFEEALTKAVYRAKLDSITDYNLFYNNATDTNDTVTGSHNLFADPKRNPDYRLKADSPAIDAGTTSYTHNNEVVLQITDDAYTGSKPDMGRYEYMGLIGYIKRTSEDAALLGDLEAMSYIKTNNELAIADDSKHLLYGVDLDTNSRSWIMDSSVFGTYTQEHPNGYAPLNTTCQYIDGQYLGFCDLEAIAYNSDSETMYLFTGNHPGELTTFKLQRNSPASDFNIIDWKRITVEHSAAIVIDNQLYVSDGHDLMKYDWEEEKTFGDVIYTANYKIEDMAYENGVLWLLDAKDMLYKIDWLTKDILGSYNMAAYGIKDPRGVEVVGDKLYIGDGDDTRTDDLKHAVHIFDLP